MLYTPGVVGRSMCYVCHFVVHTLGYFGPMLLSSPSLFMQIIRKLRRKSILPKMYVHQVETNAREIQSTTNKMLEQNISLQNAFWFQHDF